MKYQVHTFGCKVNTYDTGLLQKNMQRHGFETSGFALHLKNDVAITPGVHVLNTCAVTAEATKEAVRVIRKIKSKDPLATIVVTGCGAQVDTGAFSELPSVDLVVANSHKGMLPFLLDQHFKGELKDRVFKSNIFRKDDLEAGGGLEEKHTRAFLKIQDGCNSFCTYCIIPYARGKSRSIPIRDLVNRVNELYAGGLREVVLTGVHIGDYEDDTRPQGKIEDLLQELLLKTKMPRFRLTSLEPLELSDRLLDLYQDSRLCPHFHMSIQSAETQVLKDMKRHYTQDDVVNALFKLREKVPGCYIGMDVIVGFPTETEDRFEITAKNLASTPWTRLHVFPYSERPGTRAAVMTETVPMHVRKERGQQLRNLSLHRFQSELLAQQNTTKLAMLLKKPARGANALSRDYWPMQVMREGQLFNLADLQGVQADQFEASVRVTGFDMLANGGEGVLISEVLL